MPSGTRSVPEVVEHVQSLEHDVHVGVLGVRGGEGDGGVPDGVPADARRLDAGLPAEVVVQVHTEHQEHANPYAVRIFLFSGPAPRPANVRKS